MPKEWFESQMYYLNISWDMEAFAGDHTDAGKQNKLELVLSQVKVHRGGRYGAGTSSAGWSWRFCLIAGVHHNHCTISRSCTLRSSENTKISPHSKNQSLENP